MGKEETGNSKLENGKWELQSRKMGKLKNGLQHVAKYASRGTNPECPLESIKASATNRDMVARYLNALAASKWKIS